MERINSSYKWIEFFSGRRSRVDSVVCGFGVVVLVEKLVFNVAYEKTGVAGSHFGTHGHTIDLFIRIATQRMKNSLVLTLVQPSGVVFPS